VSVSGVSSDELYYHVGYRTYPAGTRLASFTAATKTAQDERVMAAAGALADTGTWATASVTPRHEVVSLGVGQEQRIDLASGPSAVVELRIRVSSDQADVFLRGTVLRLTWDNADTPQVETPLGDFFGSSPFLSAYHTLPVAILPDSTLACRWVMPYQERASLAFANHSGVPGALDISVTTRPRAWDDSSMYFHAYWRQDTAVHTQSQPEGGWYMVSPPRDHGFIHIHGRGFYVGTVLQVWNNAMQWWGEGDERIYVDGEAFPSFMGTGTEDYFGYAYSTTTFFEHAYHAQPHSDGFRGFTTNLRWHIADPIPFTSELRFDMEVQTAYEPATLDLGRACFFYARPGAWTDHDGLDGEDLHLRSELTRGLAPAPARLQAPVRVRVVAMYDLQGRRLAVRPSGAACAVTVQRLAGGSSAARAALSVR
jgi:hypothetical protein